MQSCLHAGGEAGHRGVLGPGEGQGGNGCNEQLARCPVRKKEPLKNFCSCCLCDFRVGKTEAQREKVSWSSSLRSLKAD